MSLPQEIVAQSNLLIDKFGYWPEFANFELLRLKLDHSGPLIVMHIYGFHAFKKTDEDGNPKKANESVITLRFSEVSDITLQGLGERNILSKITFVKIDNLVQTTIFAASGLNGKIISRAVGVVKIEPYENRDTE